MAHSTAMKIVCEVRGVPPRLVRIGYGVTGEDGIAIRLERQPELSCALHVRGYFPEDADPRANEVV